MKYWNQSKFYSMNKDKKTLEFISKAQKKFGNQFDYSDTIYSGYRDTIIYSCKTHGIIDFQNAQDHLRSKNGCPKCSRNQKKTTEEIIHEFNLVHKNKYDYSKVVYINNKTKVEILCLAHGVFLQTPSDHLTNKGCPKCVGRNFTTNEILEKAREVHKNKYDYSNIVFKTKKDKVVINCPTHGEFIQKLENHLSGKGCPRCGIKKMIRSKISNYTQEDFLIEAEEIHKNKYDYSETIYIKKHEKVKIKCKYHGLFEVKAISHLKGVGCPECSNIRRTKKQTLDSEVFFQKCNEIHNNEYEYDKDSYINMQKMITYFCETHGKIEQQAQSHLKGVGCPKCAEIKRRKTIKKNLEINFWKIIKKNKIDTLFDLSKFKYKSIHKRSIATCSKHGDFLISPDNIKRGKGCPKCSSSKGEKAIQDYLANKKIDFSCEVKSKDLFYNSLFLVEHENTRFDFVLHKHKLIIEFDGKQHFAPVGFGADEKRTYEYFKRVIKKDKAKDELVHQSNYHIARIPYWEIDNIEFILGKILLPYNNIDVDKIATYSYENNRIKYEIEILGLGHPDIEDEEL